MGWDGQKTERVAEAMLRNEMPQRAAHTQAARVTPKLRGQRNPNHSVPPPRSAKAQGFAR